MTLETKGKDQGYTLIETLVAMLLLSFIALASAGGINFGSRIWERSHRVFSSQDEANDSQTVLRAIISSAVPIKRHSYVDFEGTADELRFYAVAPDAFPSKGIVQISLANKLSDGSQILSLDAISSTDSSIAKSTIVSRGLPVRFSYLDTTGDSIGWLAVWRNRDRLPAAVKIERPHVPDWPPLIIRLANSEAANCVFDPVSLVCRND